MTVALFAAAVTATVGGMAQAATGFGFALVAVPLFTLAVTPHDAVITVTAASAILTASAALRGRRHVDRRLAVGIAAAGLAGLPVGLLALLLLPPRVLTIVVAAVTLCYLTLSATRFQLGTGRLAAASAGVVSGAALTATGMNGPPLVAALGTFRLSSVRRRATLQAIFTVQDVFAVIAFATAAEMTVRIWLLVLAAIPGAALGWVAGDRLFHRLDETTSRRLITAMLLATTVALVVHAALS